MTGQAIVHAPHRVLRAFALLACAMASMIQAEPASKFTVVESLDVAQVVSEFRVGFDILTTPSHQFVAYYDAQRRMTVASRSLDAKAWTHHVLPSSIGWDSHNYLTMALDADGHLHLSGNLHADPLIYFRTERPGDITTFQPAQMLGILEDRVTYPQFLKDAQGGLVFTYRHGGSGNGVNIYNRYDPTTRTWSRLLDSPLFDGEGLRNAYPILPARGPDGWFHTHWVWRDTPDCATNQQLSHARSRDLIHWESIFGQPVKLPIRFDHRELIVDPIPPGGGIINGGHHLAFDTSARPALAYHKADATGNMQIFIARPGRNSWETQALTDWKNPIQFSGKGSMPFIGIAITRFGEIAPGILGIGYHHREHGKGLLQIDATTLRPVEKQVPVVPDFPAELNRVTSSFPGMEIRRAFDGAIQGNDGVAYLLQWESLGPNQDRPRPPPLPPPSLLRVHKLNRGKKAERTRP